MTTANRVLSSGAVRLNSQPVRVGHADTEGAPQVELRRDDTGQEITEITVRCDCGKTTILHCHYDT